MTTCRAWLAVAGGLVALAACALPTVDEFASGDAGPAAAAADAEDIAVTQPDGRAPVDSGRPLEAGARPDASEPVHVIDPGASNLVAADRSGFENGGCLDGYRSTSTLATPGHTGAASCRACRDASSGLWSIYAYNAAAPAGERYHARAWIRRPSGSSATFEVSIAIKHKDAAGEQVMVAESPGTGLADEWQQLDVETTITSRTQTIEMYAYAEPPSSETQPCFLVDDFALWRVE